MTLLPILPFAHDLLKKQFVRVVRSLMARVEMAMIPFF
ncbi:Uncharacterised protein [Listeria grayi]|uniref:Uncharacterized protein n=1 Tax=Listeria grayi TaxID=1641 RepID=A0A378M9N8_LISGR|nr:Uncharacterised protein [Listeria grayi]